MPTRILFVDDEPDLESLLRQKYRKQLRHGELQVAFAGHGREALEVVAAAREGFDLIVTDINMPVMNGLELLDELRRLDLSALVLVLSAYGDMANIRTAMNRGAFDFLTKPIDFEDLRITTDKALSHLHSLRERSRLQHEKAQLEQRASFVRETFGRYLDDAVVQTLLDEPEGLRLGGERRALSILMSDLRGFTSLCERLPPESIVALLNSYFGAMIDTVLAHGGTIDELLGDAMLVVFGAPLHQADHADRAVSCAIAMQRAMEAVNERSAAQGLPRLEMGIAINTGEVVVGNIGSDRRTKYGVVGSHVNLTARIEALTVGNQVLISDHTLRACGLELDVVDQVTFTAKGFEEPVTVHEIRGVKDDPARTLASIEDEPRQLAPELPVRFSVSGHAGRQEYEGALVAASSTTCELRTAAAETLPPRTAVALRLHDDEGRPSTTHGKVVERANDDRVRVRFTALAPAVAARLRRLTAESTAGRADEPADKTMLSAHDTLALDIDPEALFAAYESGTAPVALPGQPPDPLATQNHLATLGLMMAGVAHDIRNPLGFVVNFSDLSMELVEELRTGMSSQPATEAAADVEDALTGLEDNLGKIRAHAERATDLIRTMMDTVRGTRGPAKDIELNPVISRHLDLFEASLRTVEPELDVVLERELDPAAGRVRVAPQDVSRVVLNLVQNACDAARAKDPALRDGSPPRVVVKTRDRGDEVEIRVYDDGIGVSESLRAAIFDPFFTTKGSKDGLGLGLALIRELIEATGGTISLHSEEGAFTEFVVTLPRAGASAT
ncbi:response regulator [Paraliomyxa miuraensis]|uniref:response regulator n=1 Tax=Paraliomyxa miuraensis TaxID=376150 RepID=UPI002255E024|nr:adenylate/guanylate cyclase domain-containing protein [Paraliomyxa miuraensis]MCX4247002.1 response regulator [Paraliomyxa miuraensis]